LNGIPTETARTVTLIEELLAEQRSLTAVAKFARAHERQELPAQAGHYRDLLPLGTPQGGEQYAFEVDLDRCSGCKSCVTACHSLNGLEEEETWRSVGLLQGGTHSRPVQQTVTTACHHCVDPACLNGCPVLAYEKEPGTGIVRHLDDQCIGCQYCVLMCPYDVPKYSERLGIVRKCDLCSNRLASDEAPACVQACPNEAIRITIVDQREVAGRYRSTREPDGRSSRLPAISANGSFSIFNSQFPIPHPNPFLPGSPDPSITLPTTRYNSPRPIDGSLQPADAYKPTSQPAHASLGVMLVLSQLSVGVFGVERVCSLALSNALGPVRPVLALVALAAGLLGLAVGALHLGRPTGAWRAFLGLRRSWLSREIVVFGAFAMLAVVHTTLAWFPDTAPPAIHDGLGWATLASGLAGVLCSAMIYHDTRRDFWHLRISGPRFLGTTALLGASAALLPVASNAEAARELVSTLASIVALAGASKLAAELPILRRLETEDWSPLYKTALLLDERFGLLHRARVACGVIGGILLPIGLALQAPTTPTVPWLGFATTGFSFALCLAGELLERHLFFAAVQPVRMPGGIPA
jgi:Fe-S-cluster-containing dehydrogenase component/DMSO reductase anchor subunit